MDPEFNFVSSRKFHSVAFHRLLQSEAVFFLKYRCRLYCYSWEGKRCAAVPPALSLRCSRAVRTLGYSFENYFFFLDEFHHFLILNILLGFLIIICQGINDASRGSKLSRRIASLVRFREKRKERCFEKKIRYTCRKEVAQR